MNRSKPASFGLADLADPESLTRVLLDHMLEGVSLSREDGTIIYTNPAEDRLFGYEPGELLGQHVSVQNAYPPQENARVVAAVIDKLRRSGSWCGEWRNRRKNGTEFITRSRITGVAINGERHWLCVQEDVTEELSTAHALAEERVRLKIATEAAEIGIWDQDVLTGRMTYSAQARSIFGLSETEELTPQRLYSIIHPDDRAHVAARARAARDPQVRSREPYEYRVVRDDGSVRWLLGRGEAIFEEVDGETRAVRYLGTLQDITERRELEEAERGAAQQLRLALQAGQMAVWDLHIATNTVTGSPQLYRLLGFPPDAPIHREAARARYYPGEAERVSAEGAAALARGETSTEVEFRYCHPDLGVRWFRLRYEVLFGDDGTPHRVIGVMLDETERKQAEAELRRLNENLEAEVAQRTADRKLLADVFESTDAMLSVAGVDLRLLAFNRPYADEVERLGGRRPRVGDHLVELYADEPDLAAPVQANWGRALQGEVFSVTEEHGDPRRYSRVYERRFEPLYDREGHLIGAYQFATDVTERLQDQRRAEEAEAAQREADALYRAYFKSTADALFVIRVDAGGGFVIEQVNPAHEAQLGYPQEEVAGRRIEEVLPPQVAEQVIGAYRRVVETGEIYQYRETYDLPVGRQHWDNALAPVPGADGRVARIIGSSRNVTQQVQAEEALRQSQKMEAMGQLTGGVAHDFNNLLTPIIASLDMLLRRGLGSERERRLMDGALQSAERAKVLVQRLLAFARRQPLQPGPVDVGRLVRNMAGLIASTLGPRVDVRVELPNDLPPALADTNQLEMAVLNLAVNARDAMPDAGVLTISAARESVRGPHRAELRPGHYVRLSVKDTGVGMDEATLARAIEPFFSTKGIGKGTGLGLSMVHGLASQLNGGLTITSSPGQGTTVDLWLPISPFSAEDSEPTTEHTSAPKSRGRALLVDDEDLVRMSTADMLMELGYEVVEARSAEEALHMVGEGLCPDLVVTDHLMPGMSGVDLARDLRTRWPDVPVLIVSGYAELEGLAPGFPRLTKPFRSAELAASLTALAPAADE